MIALGADHGGYAIKEAVKAYLQREGIPYKDFGTNSEESVDYAIYAARVAHSIVSGECEKGILCCGTGIGISMAANKVKGIRAAVCTNEFCAEMTRRHNDANVLAMGAGIIGPNMAKKITEVFLTTAFEGGRHARRVGLLDNIQP